MQAGSHRSGPLQVIAFATAFISYLLMLLLVVAIYSAANGRNDALALTFVLLTGIPAYAVIGIISILLGRLQIRGQAALCYAVLAGAALLLPPTFLHQFLWPIEPLTATILAALAATILAAASMHEAVLFGFRRLQDDWDLRNRAGQQSRGEKFYRLFFGY
jgi:hypothetical protein